MIKFLQKTNNERAQTMVEFAIVFPVLLLITYGLIEFGRMLYIYAAVTNAAREGARYGAAAGYLDDDTRYFMDCDGIRTAVRRGAILTVIADNDIRVWYDHGPSTAPLLDTNNRCPSGTGRFDQDLVQLGDRIGVRVQVHYKPIIEFLGLSGFTIQSQNARTILLKMELIRP